MISLKNGSISFDLTSMFLCLLMCLLIGLVGFFMVAGFSDGFGYYYTISNKQVVQDGTYFGDVTSHPGWAWFFCEPRTATYYRPPSKEWWTSKDPLNGFLSVGNNKWLNQHFYVAQAEITYVDDRREIGWTYYKATITFNTGEKFEREYISKFAAGWYYYPSMRPLPKGSECWHVKRAYDSRCAQHIFGSAQTVADESKSDGNSN